jgi:hypothetical protein
VSELHEPWWNFITRVNLEMMQPMHIPQIEGKILVLIRQLQNKNRL